MPDGSILPMWGYSCGTAVTGTTATCAKLNPAATGWSPVVITVPTTASSGLSINLTNNLTFLNGNKVPTSITIVGQLEEVWELRRPPRQARPMPRKLLRGRSRATTLAPSTTRRRSPTGCSRFPPRWRRERQLYCLPGPAFGRART